MVDEGWEEVFEHSVDDVEKELPLRCLLGKEFIWEEALDLIIILDHISDLEHAKFLDNGDNDVVNLRDSEDLLVAGKDLLDEVFVEVALLRQIELTLE